MRLQLGFQEQEVIFSRKCTNEDHSPIYFNNTLVTQATVQKHIELYVDEKINYENNIKEKLSKFYKGILILGNLFNELPRRALVAIYKTFIRLHLV